MGSLNWGEKQKFISSQVEERNQWASTRECLKVRSGDYLKDGRYAIADCYAQIREHKDNSYLVSFYARIITSLEQAERDFLALPPAVRLERLGIDTRVNTPLCPICKGSGGKLWEWCGNCAGWGYNVAHIFAYIDSHEEPGMVIYKVRNGVTVDVVAFGERVTVDV